MSDTAPVKLHALLGDYPVTRALRRAEVGSAEVAFDFADVKVPNTAFKRVVRDLEFDVAELAIVTFLMAKAHGKPLSLLPAVVIGRFQHPFLVYNAERGPLAPGDLAGRRVGIRSYSVTTAAWIRGILAEDYNVDLDRVRWITFEDAHVAEYRDPPAVERAAAGQEPLAMLLAGELDAAVVANPVLTDPRLKTLIPDPAAAAQDWYRRKRAIQINHMVVVRASLSQANPRAVREVYRLLLESKRSAGLPAGGGIDLNPFGVEANRRNLEVAIEYVYSQGLIPRRLGVDELFDDVTRQLGG
jgi:4,5-dihydroxyphthalate decarboxylase